MIPNHVAAQHLREQALRDEIRAEENRTGRSTVDPSPGRRVLMNYQVHGRHWVEVQKMHLPPTGVVRGWMALENGVALASIFEAIAPLHVTDRFIVCYHVMGELKPRLVRFNSFEAAQEHANKTLTGAKMIPRSLPGLGGGGHRDGRR